MRHRRHAALTIALLAGPLFACGAHEPQPAHPVAVAASASSSSSEEAVADLVTARRDVCLEMGVLPIVRLRLDADGRFFVIHQSDLGGPDLYDRGRWSQTRPGSLVLDSELRVPGVSVGSLSIDDMDDAEATREYPPLRQRIAEFLATHSDATFTADAVRSIGKPLEVEEDAAVPRAQVEQLLAVVERRLAPTTRHQVTASIGTFRGRLILTREDEWPHDLATARAELAKGASDVTFAEVESTHCRIPKQ
jgi:hypothetical protein